MKKFAVYIGLVGLLSAGLSSCSNSDTIQVGGVIENPGNVKVVSFYEGEQKLDSTFIADATVSSSKDRLPKKGY